VALASAVVLGVTEAKSSCNQAEATVVAGVGVNVLIGGSNQTIALQPVSLQGQAGLNVAAGITGIELRWVHWGVSARTETGR